MKAILATTILLLSLACAVAPISLHADEGVVPSDADVLAYRWQAMADFYARHDLLTIHPAQETAYRWQAMADFYARHDMLSTDADFYTEATDCLCYRWQAMARFYADRGMLTRATEGTP